MAGTAFCEPGKTFFGQTEHFVNLDALDLQIARPLDLAV